MYNCFWYVCRIKYPGYDEGTGTYYHLGLKCTLMMNDLPYCTRPAPTHGHCKLSLFNVVIMACMNVRYVDLCEGQKKLRSPFQFVKHFCSLANWAWPFVLVSFFDQRNKKIDKMKWHGFVYFHSGQSDSNEIYSINTRSWVVVPKKMQNKYIFFIRRLNDQVLFSTFIESEASIRWTQTSFNPLPTNYRRSAYCTLQSSQSTMNTAHNAFTFCISKVCRPTE